MGYTPKFLPDSPKQTTEQAVAGIFMLLPQPLLLFFVFPVCINFTRYSHPSDTKKILVVPMRAAKETLSSTLHSMYESNFEAVLFLVSPLVPSERARVLPAPTNLKMRVP